MCIILCTKLCTHLEHQNIERVHNTCTKLCTHLEQHSEQLHRKVPHVKVVDAYLQREQGACAACQEKSVVVQHLRKHKGVVEMHK